MTCLLCLFFVNDHLFPFFLKKKKVRELRRGITIGHQAGGPLSEQVTTAEGKGYGGKWKR